ncbi:MAG: type I-F CRISPR-associated protein Csy3 [Methylomonas sp.]|nr:type I-F CRISPR-associated protein Csy3 [Methylomonas sp.]
MSFDRKLETSDGLMYGGNWGNDLEVDDIWQPVRIIKRQNRSTQSSKGTDPKDMTKPNPVEGDDANLPHDKDTLKLKFTLRIIGNIGTPYACNDPGFEQAIIEKVNVFKADQGFETLAFRYAYNIANGRFLWRNRVCAEKITIRVNYEGLERPLSFDAYNYSLNDFSKSENCETLKVLANKIQTGLEGDCNSFVLLEINAYVKLGTGQHVFPSQEMNMGEKKKVLFELDKTAAIHNVKIGNAIRTIDDWYKNAKFPIAAEPFGAVTQRGEAYRRNRAEGDLYSLMIDWINGKTVDKNQQAYVVANLIRGGVFSKESDKSDKADK